MLPRDFHWLLETLAEPTAVFPGLTAEDERVLQALGARWKKFVDEGTFRLRLASEEEEKGEGDFWCRGDEYQRMPELAPELTQTLAKSRLVIFKGDLKCVVLLPACLLTLDDRAELAS